MYFQHETGLSARDGSADTVIVSVVLDSVEISGGQLAGLVADLCEDGRVVVQCQNDSLTNLLGPSMNLWRVK